MLMQSPARLLASLSELERQEWLSQLNTEQIASLRYNWRFWARPDQLPPEGAWGTWLALAGRGFGKTEMGAQWVRERVKSGAMSVALVAETQKDLEEVMIPRLLKVTPPDEQPEVRYRPVRLRWPTGAIAFGYNGTEPDQLRGPEFDTAWVDELAKYARARETWDMLQFTMRRPDPRVLVTTTPRPIPVIRELLADPAARVTRGSTMANADNLDPTFLQKVRAKYEGTRLGRQELEGEVLDDVPGSLWTRATLDTARIKLDEIPELARVVVAIDPSGTDGDDEGDDIGIVVAARGVDGRGYVLADLTCKLSPEGWARRAITAYHQWGADLIVAERNFGGAMVKAVIRSADRSVPFKEVVASRGKAVRAEPVSALYEQGRVSNVAGLAELEDELVLMTSAGFMGDRSPNRTDAMVWALTEVMLAHQKPEPNPEPVTIPSTVTAFKRQRA
jgi:phage terminase large subunit-like protein